MCHKKSQRANTSTFWAKKISQDCYVRQILGTGLEPCNRRWCKGSILFDRFKLREKTLTSVCTLPRAYGGRVFYAQACERTYWLTERTKIRLLLGCRHYWISIICAHGRFNTSTIEARCSEQEWEPFNLKIYITISNQTQHGPTERSYEWFCWICSSMGTFPPHALRSSHNVRRTEWK